ncbi:uncharacterized protein DUF983 [Ulvibacter sp. MAR_2010_11]|uniref:DUF983 domain-containing protein n=1 Tax=Ulvibacter sp. MAR_2010_11 TaxID=1250229 RepID=UPI000C2C5F17|nr:DUF983 domain-containing protein [Ulvibacter sp. MAR_2010_11]PKA82465.1 uncharacterized protein DUF983 [Ulvibacter sp. MAR_2010_11]
MKGSKLYSIFTGTCPVCQTGKMYKTNNPYRFSETLKMHDNCRHCDTKFKIEPSFFYGAMYVSYGVGVAIAIAAFIIANLLFGMGRLETFAVIIISLGVLFPLIMRLSRNIWINFFFSFDETKV